MADHNLSQDWLKCFTDPYAILGVSVAADDRRILKRYRQVAKLLHPDVQTAKGEDLDSFASQVLTRLVNPAYQRLKQDKGRNETLATLRFKVRRLSRQNQLHPKFDATRKLLALAEEEVEIFYEKTLAQLSVHQYDSQEQFDILTRQISELNLIYLRRKMGDPIIREKRTGLVATSTLARTSVESSELPQKNTPPALNYAEKHYQRAQTYLRTKNYLAAVGELKDAVRIEPKNSNYHCLLGQAYLLQKLPGMARTHIKQALRLNPQNQVAQKYAQKLGIDPNKLDAKPPSRPQSQSSSSKRPRGLFGSLFSRKF